MARGCDAKARETYLKKLAFCNRRHDRRRRADLRRRVHEERGHNGTPVWRNGELVSAEDALQDRDPPARPTFDAEDDPFFAATTFKDGPMVVAETPR